MMTAPVFNAADVLNHSYWVENLNISTPEARECYQDGIGWLRPDGGPIQGSDPSRRYWTNAQPESDAGVTDDRYSSSVVYDFLEYDPQPNAALPPGFAYPYGVRQPRIVSELKSKDELKSLVLARQVEVNRALWPGDAIDQRTILAGLYRAKPVKSATEAAFLADFDLRAAAMEHNELVKNACFDAIESEQAFTLETGTDSAQWVTSVEPAP